MAQVSLTDVGSARMAPRVSVSVPDDIDVPEEYRGWRTSTPFTIWPLFCLNHTKFSAHRQQVIAVFQTSHPRSHPQWNLMMGYIMNELGFAVNSFVEIGVRKALTQAGCDKVDDMMRLFFFTTEVKEMPARFVTATTRAVKAALDAVDATFGEIGERLKLARERKAKELAGMVVINDVTAQAARQQLEASREKERLIATNVSRNLKMPWLLRGPEGVLPTTVCKECRREGHRGCDKRYCPASDMYGKASRNDKFRQKRVRSKSPTTRDTSPLPGLPVPPTTLPADEVHSPARTGSIHESEFGD